MRGKSFSIALSAVSCALATVFMSLGINIPVLMLTGYVFASVVLMLPLAKDFRLGGFLAYVATCLLCLAFGGIAYFYRLFPFVAFFGLHPLVNSLQRKCKVKKWLAWPIKAVWFDGMLCATTALLFAFNVDITLPFGWSAVWIYPIVVVLGTLVFLPYDWVMFRFQRFTDYYVGKIERGRGGRPQGGAPAPSGQNEDPFDPFAEGPADNGGGDIPQGSGRESCLPEGERNWPEAGEGSAPPEQGAGPEDAPPGTGDSGEDGKDGQT